MRTISWMCLAIKVWSMFDVNVDMRLMATYRVLWGDDVNKGMVVFDYWSNT